MLSSFSRKLTLIGFSVLQPLTRLILLITIPNTSTVTARKYSRTIIHTYKYADNDDTIYFDISNSAYDGSSPLEKAALIVYGVKGYQTDVDGAVYDQSFIIDNGDFTLQTNFGFEWVFIEKLPAPTSDCNKWRL